MPIEISRLQAEALYSQHYLDLYKLALLMSKSKVLAEDAVSETFLKAFEKYHQYDPSKPAKPWLSKILINQLRQSWRKDKYMATTDEFSDIEDDKDFVATILEDEKNKALWQVVHRLKPKGKEVIVLHYFQALTLVEIATLLNIPLGTCKSRLSTALAQLRTFSPLLADHLDA